MTAQPTQDNGQYTLVNHKLLRNGYTTGSCAAAASGAAACMLLTGEDVEELPLETPAGVLLRLTIEQPEIIRDADGRPLLARCAVRKDGGDDIDATHGMLIFSEVTLRNSPGVEITGGEGIGIVTRPGLNQPVGSHAINSGPREMIRKTVEEVCRSAGYAGGISVVISAPEGVKVAEKTFNSQMGIQGGISILGTTGIVRPMSQRALLDSIELEMKMLHASGLEDIIITPGNYGETFLREMTQLDPSRAMKCSNYVGETLDMAEALGIRGILFVAHIGKFIKVSGGIMNTHSRESDARAELFAAAAMRAGVSGRTVLRILDCLTTDEALIVLQEEAPDLYEETIREILARIQKHLDRRTAGRIETGVILFAGKQTLLGETGTVSGLRARLNK